ncbi:5-(carboxyamino)imidazole ribonucleotide mutase [Nitrolancea hollandica]|jgi:5-(carboxyamino)imidazole ribonucleotide mutase|uniref:N5-carboxyaminoimidazole ribonucleotide mutase n=1 Tax=Nitrolancea hollandica Lb TaxID=1129897 RepID=I4EEK8_9BACT|nr:5-(carboxyamino)imidazole ribonucleotide mutase [Nitrolancea hollandica]CCF83120.1 phosphoribosylaminoimidazole carboxylase I [Nitrolancea hollandica Lb]
MARVGIVMGSKSDLPYLEQTTKVLDDLGLDYEMHIMSAHRTPDLVQQFAAGARDRGVKVIIAAAGGAAHLPGVVAAWTTLPVIGVPLPATDLQGWDALLAIVQMPAGVPVATVAVGTPGARNAAFLSAQIIGLSEPEFADAYQAYRDRQAEAIRAGVKL